MFAALIEKLQRRRDLTVDEAAAAMDAIMDGRAEPAPIAGLLVALAMKGERPTEIVGFARMMRQRATRLRREHAPVFDFLSKNVTFAMFQRPSIIFDLGRF